MNEELHALLRPELQDLRAYAPPALTGITTRLDANEAPPPSSPKVRDAVARAVAEVALERYPDSRATVLKERIAARTGASPGELLVGTGSDEIISLLMTALARPRDKAPTPVVVSATPTFVMYRVTARAHGWLPVEVALDAAWDLDLAGLTKAVAMMRPNLVFVATPNNPTGNRMSEERVKTLCSAAKDALVVLDEAYIDYAGAPSLRRLRADHPNVAILRTLSKVGLAALRVGWLEADEGLVREIDKARQPFNVSATSQAAAAAVLGEAWDEVVRHVSTVKEERDRFAAKVSKIPGFAVTPSDANFLWVKTPRPAEEVFAALAARGVLVRSFHASGGRMNNQLRVTIGTPEENERVLTGLEQC